jgi:hypothetical protein
MKTKVNAKTIGGLIVYALRNKLIDWLNTLNPLLLSFHFRQAAPALNEIDT